MAVAAVLVPAGPAGATWSIVAADTETGEVGAAIASCVPGEVLGGLDEPLVPIVLAPGTSAAVTQAQLNLDAPDRIVSLTASGAKPDEIIDGLIDEGFDGLAALRQHAVAATTGDVAAYTGAETNPEALDAQGSAVSVQGNLLAGTAVVDDALARFEDERAAGRSLADALVAGLAAGSAAGGDRRCDDQTALFAQVVVASPDDDPTSPATLLTVVVDEGDGQNPVFLLAEAYEDGNRGVIEAGQGSTASSVFRIVVLAIAVAMTIVAIYLFRRGLGSRSARR
jgi:uncharacterized Ntn-hydrolase superfamily protein